MKHFLSQILLIISLCVSLFAQSAIEKTPEEITSDYMEAYNDGDWDQIATLMHPDATALIRGMIDIFPDNQESQKVLTMMFNVNSKEQADSLSDEEIFARFMRFADQVKGLTKSMGSIETEILGKICEGEDTCHVLCRIDTSVKGIPYRTIEVISMVKLPTGWGILMRGDLNTMITALKQKYSNREN